MQLEIERQALQKEKDKASKERLAKIDQEVANLKEQSSQMTTRWINEKAAIADLRKVKEETEQTRHQIEEAERRADLETAARLRYGTLRELENRQKRPNKS
jgi:ATP-dependent Clp protease ATP-binding subunit ClpB